jgi:hypothetical protein
VWLLPWLASGLGEARMGKAFPAPVQTPSKLTVAVLDWKSLERNTLRGFANVVVKELQLVIRDVAIHERDGKRWVQLPGKPQIDRDGNTIRDPAIGRIKYVPVLEFGSRRVADAFGQRVLEALDVHQGRRPAL